MIPLLATLAAAEPLDLRVADACAMAVARNPSATRSALDEAIARIAARRARLDWFSVAVDVGAGLGADWIDPPDASASTSANAGWDLGATASVPLFAGGAVDASIREADLGAAIAARRDDASDLDLCRAVTLAYWSMQGVDLRLAAARESLDLTRESHAVITGRTEAGLAAAIDLNRSAVALIGEETALAALLDERFGAEQDLARLLHVDATTPLHLLDPIAPGPAGANPDDLVATALAHRPDLDASALAVDAADARTRGAFAGYLPTITLDAGVGTGASAVGGTVDAGAGPIALGPIAGDDLRPTHDATVGLTLHATPFDLFRTRDAVASAKLAAASARADLDAARRAVEADVRTLAHRAERQRSALEATRRELDLARDNLHIVQELYTLGQSDLLELFDAQQSFRSANSRAATAALDLVVSESDLNFLLGTSPTPLETP